jgi:hypothetical protein
MARSDEKQLLIKIRAEIRDALRSLDDTANRLDRLGRQGKKAAKDLKDTADSSKQVAASLDLIRNALAGISFVAFVRSAVDASQQAAIAFKGLESVANFTGVGIGRAFQEAEKLTADGLLSVAEASRALQNLLSRGYDIDQAVTTIQRLKDAAAFGRQSHLELGEAVVTATEGLKNENSVLVDNAGVTRNVAAMWKDYAAQIGKSVDDLTAAEKIQAEYNGILQETEAQLGNAAKAAQGWQGEQAWLNKALFEFRAQLGESMIPVLTELVRAGTFVIDNFLKPFITFVQDAGRGTAFLVQAIQNIGEGDFDALRRNYLLLLHERRMFEQQAPNTPASPTEGADPAKREAFRQRLTGSGTPTPDKSAEAKRKREAEAAAREARQAALAEIEARLRLEEDASRREEEILKGRFDRNLIGYQDYYTRLAALRQQDIDHQIAAKQAELDLAKDRAAQVQLLNEITLLERQRDDIVREAADGIATAREKETEKLKQQRDELDNLIAKYDRQFARQRTFDADARAVQESDLAPEQKEFLLGRIAEEYGKAGEQVRDTSDQMTQFASRAAENMQDAFADFLFDPFGSNLEDMARNFADTLRRMAAEALSQDILGAIFGNKTPSAAGGAGGLLGGAGGLLGGLGDLAKGGGGIGGFFSNLLMLFGFDEGGYTGTGGRTQPAGVVHKGEYVFSAPSVGRLGVGFLDALHGLTKGSSIPSFGYANGGIVDQMAAAGGGQSSSIRIINTVDPNLVHDYLSSPAGERVIVNHIQRNAGKVRQIVK